MNFRKHVKWILLGVVVSLVSAMVVASLKKISDTEFRKKQISALPNLLLTNLKGEVIFDTIFYGKPVALIYFNSTCEHCQYEVQDIQKNIKMFKSSQIVFMSSEPLSQILSFANSSGLTGTPGVTFTKIESEQAAAVFGTLSVPHIFIYGKNGKLRKEFKGETKAEAIANHLN